MIAVRKNRKERQNTHRWSREKKTHTWSESGEKHQGLQAGPEWQLINTQINTQIGEWQTNGYLKARVKTTWVHKGLHRMSVYFAVDVQHHHLTKALRCLLHSNIHVFLNVVLSTTKQTLIGIVLWLNNFIIHPIMAHFLTGREMSGPAISDISEGKNTASINY